MGFNLPPQSAHLVAHTKPDSLLRGAWRPASTSVQYDSRAYSGFAGFASGAGSLTSLIQACFTAVTCAGHSQIAAFDGLVTFFRCFISPYPFLSVSPPHAVVPGPGPKAQVPRTFYIRQAAASRKLLEWTNQGENHVRPLSFRCFAHDPVIGLHARVLTSSERC